MYRIGNILLLIATIIILFVGGIIINIIPVSSSIIAPSTVISLFLSTIGVSLKRKYKNEK